MLHPGDIIHGAYHNMPFTVTRLGKSDAQAVNMSVTPAQYVYPLVDRNTFDLVGDGFTLVDCPHTAPAPATVTPSQDRTEAYAYNCGAMEALLFDIWQRARWNNVRAEANSRVELTDALQLIQERIEIASTHLRPKPNPDRADDVNWLFAQLYLGRK